MPTNELARLRGRIEQLIQGVSSDLDGLACDLYEWQRQQCPAYDRLCERVVTEPIRRWQDIPAVPTKAFQSIDLRSHSPEMSSAVFRTSGTTGSRQGSHYFQDLSLYQKAALRAFGQAFGLDQSRRRCVSLIPDVTEEPHSSLSQMVTWILEKWGDDASGVDRTGQTLASLEQPAIVLGTSLQLFEWLTKNPSVSFAPDTIVMETGGFKGQAKEMTRKDLHRAYQRAGLDATRVIGEYGMTELSSQWYDGLNGQAPDRLVDRVYVPPPWARTRVVDPVNLRDVPMGDTGLLIHYDPINWGSVQAIRTSDLGVRACDAYGREGFQYVGRVPGAPLRGCSMRYEDAIG